MIDDEKLMAYADGELDAVARAEVEAAMATDPALRERVKAHRQLRQRVAGAYAGAADEPVPEQLSAVLMGKAAIVSLADARARKAEASRPVAPRAWRSWGAIAATFAAGIIAGQMIDLGPEPAMATRGGALVAQGRLAERLETELASAGTGIGLSFRNQEGRYCRTFQSDGLAGLACREAGQWDVQVAVGVGSEGSSYRMAGSNLPPAVLAAVEATIAGQPLDAAGEAAARDNGWRD
jgi:hypothetical protein